MEKGQTRPAYGYRRLILWQKADHFLADVLRSVKMFPHTEESRIIRRQLLRAAMSIPANIVEGYGGQWGKSFTRYLRVARGSAWEADYWLLLASREGFVQEESHQHLQRLCGEVIAILTSAIDKGKTST